MKRTTIFLDEPLLARAQRLAEREGRSFASVVREALAIYLDVRPATPGLPSIAGAFESGCRDTSENVDELLWSDPHQ
ncbi:MAG: ribbon-helix-helix protein, CopG family [Gemmatimonadales bacterium]